MVVRLWIAALLLIVPLVAGHAAATGLPVTHSCHDPVDALCADDDDGVSRPCGVYVMYLDIVLPADNGPLFCQDNPYAGGWPP